MMAGEEEGEEEDDEGEEGGEPRTDTFNESMERRRIVASADGNGRERLG